ncbi:MAG: hypothetical protein ABDK93_02975 [Atribacterota bacterium]
MRQTILVLFGIMGFMALVGCQWFADNPMFPRAKIAIEAIVINPEKEEVQEAYYGVLKSGYRAVRFSFRPLNRVGAEIRECRIEYFTLDGKPISSLETRFDVLIAVVPPDTPMASVYAGTAENAAISPYQLTLELFGVQVERYMQQNRIPTLKVRVTFTGVDYAGHSVSFAKEFPIKVFEGIESNNVGDIWYTCVGEKTIVFGVEIGENLEWIKQVEFFVNGEAIGSKTFPPFVSDPVSLENLCSPLTLQVLVVDVLGNQVVKKLEVKDVGTLCACSQ